MHVQDYSAQSFNCLILQNLDTQYTVGVATEVPELFYTVGSQGNGGNLVDELLDVINLLLSETTPVQTLTTSYGENENQISSALAK